MVFKKIEGFDNLEMDYISNFSGGYISRNKNLLERLELTNLTQFILEKSVFGTPIFKLGDGDNKLLILSGIHGNELPAQIANVKLLNNLINADLYNTIYFIPFAAPKSTMNNERTFNSMDLNRSAHIKNSLSSLIIQKIEEFHINFVGDFHSTARNSTPGFESIFSSKSPTPESFLIANYISRDVGSRLIPFDYAGSSYKGAVEDVCNLNGIPAITAEVLCPFANVGRAQLKNHICKWKAF